MAKYYVLCDDDCRYEGMTREEILTAIEQALEQGFVSDPDSAVFSKVKEIRANATAQIWVGTEAQFNALSPAPTVNTSVVRMGADGVLYLCTDDTTLEDSNHEHTVDQVSGIVDLIYPIGSIYMSVNNVNPANIFPGTVWEQIKDRFLLSAGDTYAAGDAGGEAEHVLTIDEIPSHSHQPANYGATGSEAGYPYHFVTALKLASDSTAIRGVSSSSTASGGYALTANDKSDITGSDRTSNTGGGAAHNNMPPYLAVYMWKRVAPQYYVTGDAGGDVSVNTPGYAVSDDDAGNVAISRVIV